MSELNNSTINSEQRGAGRRAAAVSAAIVMALLLSLSVTMKAHAVGQITITMSEAGMTPTSATASGGIVHLKVVNSSTRDALTLRISREQGGALVREIALPEGALELSTEVELGAGQYVISDASNTTLTCTLTVQ